jgi:hypothetical protein
MKKIYKYIAIAFIILTCIITTFCFWLGGWNFERNFTAVECIFVSLGISAIGTVVILGIGAENEDINDNHKYYYKECKEYK